MTDTLTLERKLSTDEINGIINETSQSQTLNQDRYQLGDILGRGTWGAVYSAKDSLTGEDIAIKVLDPTETAKQQMQHRNLDKQQAILNESRRLSACSHIVPGVFDTDKNGRVFIVMPRYTHFLSDILKDENKPKERIYYQNGLELDEIMKYLKDLSTGISESHYKLHRVHGDIKPDNIAIDDAGNALLNDFGTSTCSSIGQTSSPRDNMGCIHTRAPECFEEGSHPQKPADCYGFGAIGYRFFTGLYPREDPNFKKNINKVPRKFRKLIKSCLSDYTWKRPDDGKEIVNELTKIEENLNAQKVLKKVWTKAAPWVLGAALLGFCTYQASKIEPTKIDAPRVVMAGPVYLSGNSPGDSLKFVREDLKDLPEAIDPPMLAGLDKIVKNYTDNKNTAYLLKTYRQATDGLRDFTNETQFKTYIAYTPDYERQANTHRMGPIEWFVIGKNIGVGMSKAKLQDGSVDLEDALTIARIGEDKWNEARRVSGSFDFGNYVSAKYPDGKPVISKKEQEFVKRWIAYTIN